MFDGGRPIDSVRSCSLYRHAMARGNGIVDGWIGRRPMIRGRSAQRSTHRAMIWKYAGGEMLGRTARAPPDIDPL
jgi:hypothetical protein